MLSVTAAASMILIFVDLNLLFHLEEMLHCNWKRAAIPAVLLLIGTGKLVRQKISVCGNYSTSVSVSETVYFWVNLSWLCDAMGIFCEEEKDEEEEGGEPNERTRLDSGLIHV